MSRTANAEAVGREALQQPELPDSPAPAAAPAAAGPHPGDQAPPRPAEKAALPEPSDLLQPPAMPEPPDLVEPPAPSELHEPQGAAGGAVPDPRAAPRPLPATRGPQAPAARPQPTAVRAAPQQPRPQAPAPRPAPTASTAQQRPGPRPAQRPAPVRPQPEIGVAGQGTKALSEAAAAANDEPDAGSTVPRSTLLAALKRASGFWMHSLRQSPRAVDYLLRRGIGGEIAARFKIGYAPATYRALSQAFADYDASLLVEAGLVSVDDNGDPAKRRDRMRDRIVFPIRDVDGNVIGHGGRLVEDSRGGQGSSDHDGPPKYLNSPHTVLFDKSRVVYGLFEAQDAIAQTREVFVVEGYIDVVALAQAGVLNAVATCGTACTAQHLDVLAAHAERIIFAFDGDGAGKRAAQRALELAISGLTSLTRVGFVFLPEQHDPDSLVREQGAEGWTQQVAAAVDLEDFFAQTMTEGRAVTSAEDVSRAASRAAHVLAQARDEHVASRLAGRLCDVLCASGRVERDDLIDYLRLDRKAA